MKTAKVTTESGHTWTTEINGINEEIRAYFMKKCFPLDHSTKPSQMRATRWKRWFL